MMSWAGYLAHIIPLWKHEGKRSGGIWGHEMRSYGVCRVNWSVSLIMICPVVDSVEHGNELLGSVKSRSCIDQRSDYLILSFPSE
jgi:hypothetical protein